MLLGLSFGRLVVVFIVLAVLLLFGYLGLVEYEGNIVIKWIRKIYSRETQLVKDLILIGIIFWGWLGFISGHNFGEYQQIFERLLPIIQYLSIIHATLGFLCVMSSSAKFKNLSFHIPERRDIILIFTFFLILWIIISISGWGITPGFPYWGEAGSLLFGYQVILCTTFILISTVIIRRCGWTDKRIDWILCFIFWIVAAASWGGAKFGHNFFAPTMYDQPYYPYSDAANYDIAAQAILIGEGNSTGIIFQRPIYVTFLAVLHLLGGQNYGLIILFQIIVLSISVPFLYLIGKLLHSRLAGGLLAIFSIVLEINSIGATRFTRVTNSRLLLTEFPAGLLLIIGAYFIIKWFDDRNHGTKNVFISIGFLGLATLVRLHVIIVGISQIVTLTLFGKKKYLQNAAVLLAMLLLILVPWMARNFFVFGQFSLDPGKLDKLLEYRWDIPSEAQLMLIRTGDFRYGEAIIGKENIPGLITGLPNAFDYIGEVLAHFLHNEVLSILAFPTSYTSQSINSYYSDQFHFGKDWAGELELNEIVLIVINLIIISFGISAAVRKMNIGGIIPLVYQISYQMGNAIVRTSGWRYLKPTEWVFLLYFAIGLVEIVILLRGLILDRDKENGSGNLTRSDLLIQPMNFSWRSGINVVWGFIFFMILISLAPQVLPARYDNNYPLMVETFHAFILEKSDLSEVELENFLSNPKSEIYFGKALYPRFFYPNQGIHHWRSEIVDYKRVEMTLLNDTYWQIRFPVNRKPAKIIQGSDILVLGCRTTGNNIEALIIAVVGEQWEIYQRDPLPKITCPLAIPTPPD